MAPDRSVRRVLIYRLGSLGDMVVALPCFHLIARAFPDAERRLLTNLPVGGLAPPAAAVLDGTGLVHGYTVYPIGTRSPLRVLRLAAEIRRFQPEVVVCLTSPRGSNAALRDGLFFRMLGVRGVIGVSSATERDSRFDWRTGLYEAEAVRLARMLSELGDARLDCRENWSLRLTNRERQEAEAALPAPGSRRLIVCAPGTKMPSKDWGEDRWRELLGRIGTKHPELGLALLGARAETEVAEHAAGLWAGAKVNLCGLSPRTMAAVMEQAEVFVGPDSGPMHVAAAMGLTCVIPFAATQLPGVWFPHGEQHQVVYHRTPCAGCRLTQCSVEAQRCTKSISVDAMEAAFERALDGTPGVRTVIRIA